MPCSPCISSKLCWIAREAHCNNCVTIHKVLYARTLVNRVCLLVARLPRLRYNRRKLAWSGAQRQEWPPEVMSDPCPVKAFIHSL
jgi:hypothetical protein